MKYPKSSWFMNVKRKDKQGRNVSSKLKVGFSILYFLKFLLL